MLQIHSFTFNPFQENTYLIVAEDKQCWIVDPGMFNDIERREVTGFLQENGLLLRGIINTHTHIDHILGVPFLIEQYNVPFQIHQLDEPVLKNAPASAMMFGMPLGDVPVPDSYIPENQILMLGAEQLQVFFTPGHSPGSISFYYAPGGWILSGDVLFAGSIGRTDLPGGDFDTLIASIKNNLLPLPDETVVYSGHGPATTIGAERRDNPFLQGI